MKLLKQLIEAEQGWRVIRDESEMKDSHHGGRVGSLDDISYAEIKAKLGEPTYKEEPNDGDGRTVVEWWIEGTDGSFARIYDYKTSAKYNGDFDMDMSELIDDEDAEESVRKRVIAIKGNQTEAQRLGVDNIRCWSIGGDVRDWGEKQGGGSAVELVKRIFGDKAVHSSYDKSFRDMFKQRGIE